MRERECADLEMTIESATAGNGAERTVFEMTDIVAARRIKDPRRRVMFMLVKSVYLVMGLRVWRSQRV